MEAGALRWESGGADSHAHDKRWALLACLVCMVVFWVVMLDVWRWRPPPRFEHQHHPFVRAPRRRAGSPGRKEGDSEEGVWGKEEQESEEATGRRAQSASPPARRRRRSEDAGSDANERLPDLDQWMKELKRVTRQRRKSEGGELPTSTQCPPRRAANDEPPGWSQAQRNYRGQQFFLARAALRRILQRTPTPQMPAHHPVAVAAFVELVHLDALLEVEARSLVTAIEHPKRLQHDHAPTDDHHLAVTRMSQSAPRRKRAERAARKMESEMRSPPPTPLGRLSPLLSP